MRSLIPCGELQITSNDLRGSHPPHQADLATSSKTGQNCSDEANAGKPSRLKQLIANRIPWQALPWTATPRLLAEMKEALLKMRASTDIRLLRFSELAQRLEQALPGERFGESEVRTAVTLLANHGLALPSSSAIWSCSSRSS